MPGYKSVFLFFIFLVPVLNPVYAGFDKSYSWPGAEVCYSITVLNDSTVLMFGYAESGTQGGYDFCLQKTDYDGNLLWRKFLGTTGNDIGLGMSITADNCLLLSGTTDSSAAGNLEDVLLIKCDTSGNVLWRKVYPALGTQACPGVSLRSDGGFLLAGYAIDIFGTNDHLLINIDSAGSVIWQRNYGGSDNDYAHRVLPLPDGRFLLSGDTKSQGAGLYDSNLLMLSDSGDVVWDSAYGDALENGCQGVFEGADQAFYIFGETQIFPQSPFDAFITRVDSNGYSSWSSHFGGTGTEAIFDMIPDAAGTFTGCGYSNSVSNGQQPVNLAVFRTDISGNYLWTHEFGSPGIDIGFDIVVAPGGGYFVGGRTTGTDDDMYLLRLDANGLTDLNELDDHKKEAVLYPNPSSGGTYIKNAGSINSVSIRDITGRTVWFSDQFQSLSPFIPDPGTQGLYMVEIVFSDGSHGSLKWLVVR